MADQEPVPRGAATRTLRIEVTVYFPTKRRADWDNFHKLSMDALNGIVWEDDSQVVEAMAPKAYGKENLRIAIAVEELKGTDHADPCDEPPHPFACGERCADFRPLSPRT